MDFSQRIASSTTEAINMALCPALDDAISAAAKAEYEAGRGSGAGDVAAKRIGAGYIGTPCARELAFRFHKFPKEDRESSVSKGELQRHAEAGHWTEEKTAEWLRLVGFTVITHKVDFSGDPLDPIIKRQIGWKAARDPATGQFRMAGEVDGIITAVPTSVATILPVTADKPAIWESKKATDKKWKKFVKEGVKKADARYYGQLQTNMAYMDLTHTLFSMLNLDNMKFYFEVITFNQADAQAISDRAVKVLESNGPEDMPRLGRAEDDHVCRFCDFHGQCWKGLVLKPVEPMVQITLPCVVTDAPNEPPLRPVFNPNFPVGG